MHTKISKFFFTLVVFSVLAFTLLFLFNTRLYDVWSLEDHIVEYLSSFFLLLSSVLFLRSLIYSKKKKSTNSKWLMFLLVGISLLFFLAAGEEISWGQRIFKFSTPTYLSSINDQNELNFHNINKKFFDRVLDRITILFVVISSVLLLLKKDVIRGIKNPDIFIICAFAITPFYRQHNDLDFYHILYLPLVGLLIYSIINKVKFAFFTVLITLVISFLIPIIHSNYHHLFPLNNNSANEFKEFLFCLCCLDYSYVIMAKIKLDTTKPKMH